MTILDTLQAERVHPARSGPRPMTPEDLWALPRVGAPAPAPDGSACVVPVTVHDLEKNASRTRLWWVPLDGEPKPLTADEPSAGEPVFSPDGRRLAFTRKVGARSQVHVLPLEGGEAECVTSLPLGAFDPHWLPDGRGLVFGAMLVRGHLTPEATKAELERREKEPLAAHITEERFYRYWDTWLTTGEVPHLFHLDLATRALRDLTPGAEGWFEWMEPAGQFDVSPDGAEIAWSAIEFDHDTNLIRSRVWTVPVAGGTPQPLPVPEAHDDVKPRYSPDGRAIVFGRQLDPNFYADRVRLMRFDRATRAIEELAPDWDRSPSRWLFTADGALVAEAEDRARTGLFRVAGPAPPVRLALGGTLAGTRAAGGRLWFTEQTLVDPAELGTCALDGSGRRRVSHFSRDVASRYATGEVRELMFEGAFGETVQMWLVLPPGHVEGSKPPLVHVIHGGPHATSADAFHGRWNAQLFAAPGYVVALVNFQGSTSWGQDFAKRIQGAWAERPYDDVMKATDLLVERGLVDGTRMAATGGSYGGYMAAWIAGHTDRFRCIVNHAGVSDLMLQYGSDVTQGRGHAAGGEAWDGLERMERWSPVRFANGFVTPMLVLHGERDYRVPVGHALQVYGILKAKGVPARLVYFPDENHWVLKPRNALLWNHEVHAWLDRWLGTGPNA